MDSKYSELTDEELILRMRDDDPKVVDIIMDKYKDMVRNKARSMYILGAEPEDLIQEGMIGLFKAVRDFDEHKNIKFSTFAQICVKRNIYTAITNSNSPKNEPLNKGLSISHTDSSDDEFKNLSTEDLGLSEIYNPEDNLINKEKYDEIVAFMGKELSKLEYQVMDLYIIGLKTSEIARVLGKNEKTTDNAFQRAKNKIRKYLEER